jgi:N-methylhydantoinase B
VTQLAESRPSDGTAPVPIRELSDPDFRARYECDRFTATVLANRFRYVAQHMCSDLMTHAFSPIIRDSADLSGTLSGSPHSGFPMAAVSETLPLFYGSIPDAVRIALEEYGLERLVPGDMVMVNDYYRVGTHLNDVCNILPIFYQADLVGAVTIRAHMLDMGGRTMGGFESTKLNVYEDGLRLPPILLYSAGEPVPSTFKLLHDNTRFASLIIPDLRTMFHALKLGEGLVVETIDKYGLDAYMGAIRYVNDASAETMASALGALPDGVYEAEERLDGDGLADSQEYSVRVRIEKRGTRAEFDLRGSSAATRTAVNCSWADVKSAVAIALKFLIDPKNPVTSGTLRDVDIVLSPDTLVNPSPPHCCQFYWEPVLAIINAIFKALTPIVGADAWASSDWGGILHRAEGRTPDGTPWSSPGGASGGSGAWGATKDADGDSSQQMIFLNMMSSGVETSELSEPFVLLRNEYVTDTAGPGRYRGGAANVRDARCLYDGAHRVQQFHIRRPPAVGGVHGGSPGSLGAVWMWDGAESDAGRANDYLPLSLDHPMYREALPLSGVFDPENNQADPAGEYVFVSDEVSAAAGSVLRILHSAGGGWGDPFQRDAERVLRDVRDEYVTIAGAARDYGVVVRGDPARDPEGLRIDWPATEKRRGQPR